MNVLCCANFLLGPDCPRGLIVTKHASFGKTVLLAMCDTVQQRTRGWAEVMQNTRGTESVDNTWTRLLGAHGTKGPSKQTNLNHSQAGQCSFCDLTIENLNHNIATR